MNSTLTLGLCAAAMVGVLVSAGRVIVRAHRPFPGAPLVVFGVAMVGWLGGAGISWVSGHEPARPGVFLGYATTTAALVVVGVPLVSTIGGRAADVARVVTFALIAFVCWRTQEVWSVARP